jgi:hypothetical protein
VDAFQELRLKTASFGAGIPVTRRRKPGLEIAPGRGRVSCRTSENSSKHLIPLQGDDCDGQKDEADSAIFNCAYDGWVRFNIRVPGGDIT